MYRNFDFITTYAADGSFIGSDDGTYGAQLLGGLDGELEVLERLLVVRGVAPREIETGHCEIATIVASDYQYKIRR
jgi:hypothetical protein